MSYFNDENQAWWNKLGDYATRGVIYWSWLWTGTLMSLMMSNIGIANYAWSRNKQREGLALYKESMKK
jgi:hypothetical protein